MLSLDLLSGLSGLELVSRLLQAVYVGCETCAKPLTQVCIYIGEREMGGRREKV